MTQHVYLAATEENVQKTGIALAVFRELAGRGKSVGFFRPIVTAAGRDEAVEDVLSATGVAQGYDDVAGVTLTGLINDPDEALAGLIAKFAVLRQRFDVIVSLGSDFDGIHCPTEFSLNARVAANLNATVVLLVPGRNRSANAVAATVKSARDDVTANHTRVVGVIATEADPGNHDALTAALGKLPLASVIVPVGAIPVHLDTLPALVDAALAPSRVRTPLAFEYELMELARRQIKRIVLPESTDDRILESAAIVNTRGFARIILLGDEDAITRRARDRGWNLAGVDIINPTEPALIESFAATYAELRASKGVTIEQARTTFADLSYVGTMMVHLGQADGMVSGAINTTANTIRPSLQFIKTKPGVRAVSGAVIMCMPDRVDLYADIAVNTNPTPDQLADIVTSTAETATRFGIDPKVALLSYSTGTSSSGPDVEAVAEATRLARLRAPELPIEGPIQFDAAVDPTVARTKLPTSAVAGKANVFIFPDLNCGNTTYKAVQRAAGAVAIGPLLQGLNKPVNDLSRGAQVKDIVNTIAITAIQAQG